MSSEKVIELIADSFEAEERIDSFLSAHFEDMSRTFLQKLIKDGKVVVNGKNVKPSYKVDENDLIVISIDEIKIPEILAEDIPLDIVYEDDDLLVVNKPKGMVVHPSHGHYSGTLVNALMYHCKDSLSGINGIMRPGIVHRIDKDTTGLLLVAKNDYAHHSLAEQLKAHTITRRYHAIVNNCFTNEEGRIDFPIGRDSIERKKMCVRADGKEAITNYKVLQNFPSGYSYVECRLETGRTHQIRVHMSYIKHPLLGDAVYGPSKCQYKLTGQTLHAKVLGFVHPRTNEYMEFDSELPEYFASLLNKL